MNIRGIAVGRTAKDLLREVKDDDLTGLAAELSYRFFLAIFPFVIFLAALGGLIAKAVGAANPAQRVVGLFGDTLPADAASIVRDQVNGVVNAPNAGLLSISLIGALWAASGGVGAVLKATNRAYDIPESRGFVKKTGLALGLTVSAGAAIVLGFVLLVATQAAGGDIADALGLGRPFAVTVAVVRWPLVLALAMAGVSVVYWAAPNTGLPYKWATPGAALFAVLWLIVTALFGLYVANFSSYNATYGALGGVVVLLLWFYLTSLVLLIGAELNAVLDEEANGPVLADRRQKVAGELEARRREKPANPESVAVPGGVPPAAQAAPEGAAAQTTSPVMAIAGLALAAIAWRRVAR